MSNIAFMALSVSLVAFYAKSSAQDIRAATYQWVENGSFTLIDNILKLYVDSALDLNRDLVIVTIDDLDHALYLNSTESVMPGIVCHTFKNTLVYAGPGVYEHFIDMPFRVEPIVNFNSGSEISLGLHPVLVVNSIYGYNSTPVCDDLQAGIAQSANGATFTPSCFDVEDDSMVFSLTDCSGAGYYLPGGCTIDSVTGVITADPPFPGLYAFCTKLEEYRLGVIISTTYTDMVMEIDNVTSVAQVAEASALGLSTELIRGEGTITVHANGTALLQLIDASGRTVVNREVLDGTSIDVNLGTGVYVYLLREYLSERVLHGKMVVF